MDNTIVSARVARGKKERANAVLESMGATMSDAVNHALDYVIANKRLPGASSGDARSGADSRVDGYRAFVEASTLSIEWPADSAGDYKAILKRGRLADYESLA